MKLLILFLLLSIASPAQVPATEASPELILVDPEIMPEFKGGHQALMRYLQDSVKSKAVISLEESYVLKTVYAKFSISETGKVSHVRILRSCNVPHLDSLYKSALENMPDWIPGSINGKPKSADMNLPLRLELN